MNSDQTIQTAILAPTLAARVGLRTLLAVRDTIRITVEATDFAGLEYTWMDLDIVVVQGRKSLEGIESLLDSEINPGLLWIHDDLDAAQTLRSLALPAWGLLSSEASSEELIAAIFAIHQGLITAPRAQLDPLWIENRIDKTDELAEQLTPREAEILEQLAQGLANKQIALDLEISEHTVKFHVSSIYAKLGATNRMEAVRIGLQRGLITL